MSGFLDKHYAARTVEEVNDVYDAWAPTYESELEGEQYAGASSVAEIAAEFIENRNAEVLDVGCGTGLVGEQLSAVGFANLYGIDLSLGMLDQARAKGCYRDLEQANLLEPIALKKPEYDVVVSAGLFTRSLLGPDVLRRVLALVVRGGYAVIGINALAYAEQDYALVADATVEQRGGECLAVREMPYWPEKGVASTIVVLRL